MKGALALVLATLTIVSAYTDESCMKKTAESCDQYPDSNLKSLSCTSKLHDGDHFRLLSGDLLSLQLRNSFHYMHLYGHFTAYKARREGFAKLYKKLSDEAWEDSIKIIKYVNRRGERVHLPTTLANITTQYKAKHYASHELNSISLALDMHKTSAMSAFHAHSMTSRRDPSTHDAETMSFLENEFTGKFTQTIRKLTGYFHELKKLVSSRNDFKVGIFLFDDYLKSAV